MDEEKLRSIRQKAALLAGELPEEGMVEMACERAMAHCNRSDIPPAMEQAVAALTVALTEGDVRSLTRGDTSISYYQGGLAEGLRPFCRLGTVRREGGV